jgi:hypothetical protein
MGGCAQSRLALALTGALKLADGVCVILKIVRFRDSPSIEEIATGGARQDAGWTNAALKWRSAFNLMLKQSRRICLISEVVAFSCSCCVYEIYACATHHLQIFKITRSSEYGQRLLSSHTKVRHIKRGHHRSWALALVAA